jgi:3-hydroxybutyryl-CoA dehydratase
VIDAAPPTETFFARPFERLSPGESWESDPILVDSDRVLAFADLTGDRHPVHVDPDWAAATPFGGLIAHGMLVLSLATGAAPFDPRYVAALRGIRDVVLKRPVAAGTRIRVGGEIEALRPVDRRRGLVTIRIAVRDGDGHPAVRGLLDVLWQRERERDS